MSSFRARAFVAFFFCLISFGQAYPYSFAWALGETLECGCNLSGRKCIHGCDLKKHKQGHDHETAAVSHDHHAMSGHAGHHEGMHAALQDSGDESAPTWVNPDCSRQQRRQVLDFRGDPYLPPSAPPLAAPIRLSFFLDSPAYRAEGIVRIEVPPPKV